MYKDSFLDIKREQFLDFDFLCETICNNTAEMLARSFLEAYDSSLPDTTEVILQSIVSVWNYVQEVKNNLDEYRWLYNLLYDDFSKETLLRILLSRFLVDEKYLEPVCEPITYFNWNMLVKKNACVYVDCGAFTGDSVWNFLKYYGDTYAKIIAYEPTPDSFKDMRSVLSKFFFLHKNIVLKNCGVGEFDEELNFSCYGGLNMANRFDGDSNAPEENQTKVPVVSLDSDILEPVSFIKMDIEGYEMNALKGAKYHIVNDKPQLAICTYHKVEDLRTIPRLIHSYNQNQRFYLRHHIHFLPNAAAYEHVFYADPY